MGPELPPIAVQYHCHGIQRETRDNDSALLLVKILVTRYRRFNYFIHYIYYKNAEYDLFKT